VSVRGANIKRVDFRLDGRRIGGRGKAAASQRQVDVQALPGKHTITARVTFKDGARSQTMKLDYRACASAVRRVRRGPSQFTG
jgi:hypothetical protein